MDGLHMVNGLNIDCLGVCTMSTPRAGVRGKLCTALDACPIEEGIASPSTGKLHLNTANNHGQIPLRLSPFFKDVKPDVPVPRTPPAKVAREKLPNAPQSSRHVSAYQRGQSPQRLNFSFVTSDKPKPSAPSTPTTTPMRASPRNAPQRSWRHVSVSHPGQTPLQLNFSELEVA